MPGKDREARWDAADGRIHIYADRFEAYLDSRRLDLTLVQYRILSLIAQRPGWVFTPDQIVSGLEAHGVRVEATSLKNHIYQLRRRLGQSGGGLIETVRGVGYRLAEAPPHSPSDEVSELKS